MKINAWLIVGCMTQMSAFAADVQINATVVARSVVRAALADDVQSPARSPVRVSPFALAIQQAARKGVIESSVEGYTEVLIRCQKEISTVLTTPFLRSDSQQAHCFRF